MVTEEYPTSYWSGPEYRVIGDENFPGKLEDWQKVASNYAMDPAQNARPKPAGKWKDAPGYGMSKVGHIAVQDHGSEAWFRNIEIKKL